MTSSETSLRQPIVHAPIAGDSPRKNGIVRPGYPEILSSGIFQYFATSARVGCTVPSSSVQRDMITHSFPSHFQ